MDYEKHQLAVIEGLKRLQALRTPLGPDPVTNMFCNREWVIVSWDVGNAGDTAKCMAATPNTKFCDALRFLGIVP